MEGRIEFGIVHTNYDGSFGFCFSIRQGTSLRVIIASAHRATVAGAPCAGLGSCVQPTQAMASFVPPFGAEAASCTPEEELHDLAGHLIAAGALDMTQLQAPLGAVEPAPLMEMLLWDVAKVRKIGNWRCEEFSDKWLVCKVAKALVALKDLREAVGVVDASRVVPSSHRVPGGPRGRRAGAVSANSTPCSTLVVEPTLALRRKRQKFQADGSPQVSSTGPSKLSASSAANIFSDSASYGHLPRGHVAQGGDHSVKVPAGATASWRIWPGTGSMCGSALRNPSHKWGVQAPFARMLEVWTWTMELIVRLSLFTLTWAPPVVVLNIIVYLFTWPELFFDGVYNFFSAPGNYWSYASARVSARIRGTPQAGELHPGFYEIPGHPGTFAWRPGFEQSGVTPGVYRQPWRNVTFGPDAPDWHQGSVWVTDSAPAPAAVAAPGPWWTGGTALVGALAWKGGSTILSAFAKQ